MGNKRKKGLPPKLDMSGLLMAMSCTIPKKWVSIVSQNSIRLKNKFFLQYKYQVGN